MTLARLEEQEGNMERAARLYQGLVDAGEKSAAPQLALARLEIQAGAYDAALDYSARAVKTDPESYAGYELAGSAWMGKQDYAEAAKAYMQAWERRQSSGLVLKLSHAFAGAGNHAEAASYLEQWLGKHEGDVRAREFLGTVYQNQGEDSKAVTAYERVLQQEPGNPVALNNLAWLYVIEDNPRALELASRAHRENPDNAGIKDTYGWVLVQSGQAGEGLKLLTEAIDALPDVSEVRYHYAVALMKSGRQDEGRQRLRELLDSGAAFEGREQAAALLGDS
jgi:Flp pilus assembly protein TadD